MKKTILVSLAIFVLSLNSQLRAVNYRYISFESLYNASSNNIADGVRLAQNKAIELAKLLDKGMWYGQVIRSTLVLNYNNSEFYILATLGNGNSVKIYMDDLRVAAHSGKLALVNNRYLVFPDDSNVQFDVFDKSEFYNLAIRAKYYRESYPITHQLGGKTFYYAVKRLNGVRDMHYEIELYNGALIKLGYLASYRSIIDSNLVANVDSSDDAIFSNINWITNIAGFSKIDNFIPSVDEVNLKSFGIHVVFENEVNYIPSDIGIAIDRSPNGSYIDISIPNSTLAKNIKVNDKEPLEYLSGFSASANNAEAYATVRAKFFNKNLDTVDFLYQQPTILLHPDRKNLFIVFYHDPNQVIDYGVYNWTQSQINFDKRFKAQSLQPLTTNLSDKFTVSYNLAIDKYNEALKIKNWPEWITKFQEVSVLFNTAATYATSDRNLSIALAGRNLAVDHVFNAMLVNDIYPILQETNFSKSTVLPTKLDELSLYTRAHAAKDSFIKDVKLLSSVDSVLNSIDLTGLTFKIYSATDIARFRTIINSNVAELSKVQSSNKEVMNAKSKLLLLAENLKVAFKK